MSQLIEFYNWFTIFLIYITIVSSETIVFLLFYPTGIFFAILIIFYLIYILTVFKQLIVSIYGYFNYAWTLRLTVYNYLNKTPLILFWDLLMTLLMNNSTYYYVFLVKRLQFFFSTVYYFNFFLKWLRIVC